MTVEHWNNPTEPAPELSPSEVISIQLEALKNNDMPTPDSGIRTTFSFASPANRQFTGPIDRFIALVKNPLYASMLNYQAAELGPLNINEDQAYQLIKLVDRAGQIVIYSFALSRQHDNEYEGCWMTDGVTVVRQPGQSQA